MGSVKSILSNAHDPIVNKERDLLTEEDSGLAMIQHACNSALITHMEIINNIQKRHDDIKEFLMLVEKARQLKKDEHN